MEKNDFLIPLNGLPQGQTSYKGLADKQFFESFGNVDILDATIEVSIAVAKSGQYTGVDCDIEGEVTVACDRCLDPVAIPVSAAARLSVKFGKEEAAQSEDDEADREVVWLMETEADLDLSQTVYDYVCLALPIQRMHPEGECNPSVLKYLEEGIRIEGEHDDEENPFAVLKGMIREDN